MGAAPRAVLLPHLPGRAAGAQLAQRRPSRRPSSRWSAAGWRGASTASGSTSSTSSSRIPTCASNPVQPGHDGLDAPGPHPRSRPARPARPDRAVPGDRRRGARPDVGRRAVRRRRSRRRPRLTAERHLVFDWELLGDGRGPAAAVRAARCATRERPSATTAGRRPSCPTTISRATPRGWRPRSAPSRYRRRRASGGRPAADRCAARRSCTTARSSGCGDVDVPPEESVDPPASHGRPGLRMVGPVALPHADAVDGRSGRRVHDAAGRGSGSGPTPRRGTSRRSGADPGSVLSLYRRLIALRAATPALQVGALRMQPTAGRRTSSPTRARPTDELVARRRSTSGRTAVAWRLPDAGRDAAGGRCSTRPRPTVDRRGLRDGSTLSWPPTRAVILEANRPDRARRRPCYHDGRSTPTHAGEHHVPLDFLKRKGNADDRAPTRPRRRRASAHLMPEEVVAQDHQLKLYYAGKSSEGVRLKAGPGRDRRAADDAGRPGAGPRSRSSSRCRSSSARRRRRSSARPRRCSGSTPTTSTRRSPGTRSSSSSRSTRSTSPSTPSSARCSTARSIRPATRSTTRSSAASRPTGTRRPAT